MRTLLARLLGRRSEHLRRDVMTICYEWRGVTYLWARCWFEKR